VNRLQRGWQLGGEVKRRIHRYESGRVLNIYHFTLVSGSETLEIPVKSNPIVLRLIQENKLKVVPFDQL
jgi:hypothetical protein